MNRKIRRLAAFVLSAAMMVSACDTAVVKADGLQSVTEMPEETDNGAAAPEAEQETDAQTDAEASEEETDAQADADVPESETDTEASTEAPETVEDEGTASRQEVKTVSTATESQSDTSYDAEELESQGYEREEVKYETDWSLREGDLFEVDLVEAFSTNISYKKESSVSPSEWQWIALSDGNGTLKDEGTDSFKDSCVIYLGKYDITAIDEFTVTMGLNGNKPTVELWADCVADESGWTEDSSKNSAGSDTKIYTNVELSGITGGTLLGKLSGYDSQSTWNAYDYSDDCLETSLTGEHDLYLKITKVGTGTWLGNVKGFSYVQRHTVEVIQGTEVTGITYQFSPEDGEYQADITDGTFSWDTTGVEAGDYGITFSGTTQDSQVGLTLNVTVKERKQVVAAVPVTTNQYVEREDGYQYSVVAGDTLDIDVTEVLGKWLKSETEIDISPKSWEWIVLNSTTGLSLSNDYLGGRDGFTLYLGEYDITDIQEFTLNLGAPSTVSLTQITLLADCELSADPSEWTEAGVDPTEDANATVCYAKSALDYISGGTAVCDINDFSDAVDGVLTGSGSFTSYKAYTAQVNTELTGTHKLYLCVKASTTWFGNLQSVTLKMSTDMDITEAFDAAMVTAEELPQGAGLEGESFVWDTTIEQGGNYTITLKSSQTGYCPEREIEVEVQDYPILPELEEQTFWYNQKNELVLETRNPDSQTQVTYEGIGLPAGMEITTDDDGVTGIISWTPTEQQKGTYRFGIIASGRTTSPIMYYTVTVAELEEYITDLDEAMAIASESIVGYRAGEYTFYAKRLLTETLSGLTAQDGTAIAEAVALFRMMVNTEETGDVNGDGSINMTDLSYVIGTYGTDDEPGDVDQDGRVSLEDMVHVAKNVDDGIYRTSVLGADDALYVTSGSAWMHYVNTLDAQEDILVHFDVSDLAGDVQAVRLVLNLAQGYEDTEASVTVRFVEDDETVKMNDAENRSGCVMPSVSEYGMTVTASGGKLEVDVTEMVKNEADGDGEITFYLHSEDEALFVSDDGGDVNSMPRLLITSEVDEETAASIDAIEEDFAALGLTWPEKVSEDQNFADSGENGTTFSWRSEDEYVITDGGVITRAVATLEDTFTHVTVTATNGDVTVVKRLSITVVKQDIEDYTAAGEVEPEIQRVVLEEHVQELIDTYWSEEDDTFESVNYPEQYLDGLYVTVEVGDDIQEAMDRVSEAGGGVVILAEGIHEISQTLVLRSNVTLVGYGKDRSIMRQSEDLKGSIIDTSTGCVENFVFKDLSIEGVRGYENNASGILMAGSGDTWHNRIMLQNVRVKNCGSMGIHVKRVNDIIMDQTEVVYNGESSGYYHNVYFLYNYRILQSDLDLSRPVTGKSCKYTATWSTIAQRVTMKDGTDNAIQADHTGQYLMLYKYEIDNFANIALWFPCENYTDKYTYTESPTYAMQKVILYECSITNCYNGGILRVVEDPVILNSYFNNITHDLELLKCGTPIFTGTVFDGPDGRAIEYDRADLPGYYLTE